MSFFIDTGDTITPTETNKPTFLKYNYDNNEECLKLKPPSFVNKILENISKLDSNDFEKSKPTVKSQQKFKSKNNINLEEECKNIGKLKGKKKRMNITVSKDPSKVDEILKKSVITPGYEKLHSVLPYDQSEHKLKAQRKLERSKTKGIKWYGLPATELTEEVKHDLDVLQMRSVLDPKHFYKKNDLKVLPKYFQIGKVMDSPLDYYSNRCTKKERKRTLVDELLADAEFNKYNKKRYVEITEERRKTHYKAYRHAKKLKRKNK